MTKLLLSFLLTAPTSPLGHGIYGGFALRWVPQMAQVAQVALSAGSAVIDGHQVATGGASFPNDSPLVTPLFPTIVPLAGQSFAAYCYVLDLGARAAVNTWFAPVGNADAYDFQCYVGSTYAPSADGHPSAAAGVPYNYPGVGNINITDAIFVGSVVGTQLAANKLYNGNPPGFSVIPFFRNGSQAIYATDNNVCANCLTSTWDLGIPTQRWPGPVSVPIGGTNNAQCPTVDDFDFTVDGATNVLPLSASQVIYDFEGHAHEGVTDTACFMDPNYPAMVAGTLARSCQTEVQLDPQFGNWRPVHPFRASQNIGMSTVNGAGYGETWIATACTPPNGGMAYFDIAYRGYVEPERQLVPQIHP